MIGRLNILSFAALCSGSPSKHAQAPVVTQWGIVSHYNP